MKRIFNEKKTIREALDEYIDMVGGAPIARATGEEYLDLEGIWIAKREKKEDGETKVKEIGLFVEEYYTNKFHCNENNCIEIKNTKFYACTKYNSFNADVNKEFDPDDRIVTSIETNDIPFDLGVGRFQWECEYSLNMYVD